QVRVDFLAEQLDGELVASGEGVPVDVPQVVAGLVVAVVLELQRAAAALAQGAAGHAHRCLPRQPPGVAHPRPLALDQILTQAVARGGINPARRRSAGPGAAALSPPRGRAGGRRRWAAARSPGGPAAPAPAPRASWPAGPCVTAAGSG